MGSDVTLEVESKPHEFNGNSYWAIADSTPEVAFDSSRIVFEGTTYWIIEGEIGNDNSNYVLQKRCRGEYIFV